MGHSGRGCRELEDGHKTNDFAVGSAAGVDEAPRMNGSDRAGRVSGLGDSGGQVDGVRQKWAVWERRTGAAGQTGSVDM